MVSSDCTQIVVVGNKRKGKRKQEKEIVAKGRLRAHEIRFNDGMVIEMVTASLS